MRFANAGVTGINFFTSSSNTSYYSPFNFVRSGSFPNTQYLSPKVNPLYYGILMLAETLQNHGALLPASVTSDSQSIKAWAVRDTCGTIRLLLINKDQNVGGKYQRNALWAWFSYCYSSDCSQLPVKKRSNFGGANVRWQSRWDDSRDVYGGYCQS